MVGVSAIDTSVAGVTVRVVAPDTFPDFAVIVVLPRALPFAWPGVYIGDPESGTVEPATAAASTTVATFVSDEVQFTNLVRSLVVLSE